MSPENRKEIIRLAHKIVKEDNANEVPVLNLDGTESYSRRLREANITAAIDDIQAILTYRRF